MRAIIACLLVGACGSSSSSAPPPAAVTTTKPHGPSEGELAAKRARDEQAEHDRIVAAHREAESEQQDALAASCGKGETAQPRCMPSCYANEPKDPREGQKVSGAVEVQHLVCQGKQDGDWGAPAIVDELEPKLKARAAGRFGSPHKKGTWQADLEATLRDGLPKGDAFVITGTAWRELAHPITHEPLRCVTASHFTRALRGKLDACAGTGKIACEAGGNPAAHAIDVVHYRLVEARQLQAKGKEPECQQAALEAIAVARGLPRWRQYKKLNVGQWTENLRYRTRFDGTLDEDALIATTTTLGTAAESVYAACGGVVNVKTKPEQEQSFHMCF